MATLWQRHIWRSAAFTCFPHGEDQLHYSPHFSTALSARMHGCSGVKRRHATTNTIKASCTWHTYARGLSTAAPNIARSLVRDVMAANRLRPGALQSNCMCELSCKASPVHCASLLYSGVLCNLLLINHAEQSEAGVRNPHSGLGKCRSMPTHEPQATGQLALAFQNIPNLPSTHSVDPPPL